MKIVITPRGFATYGLKQIEFMKKSGFEVHYNDTGKAYTAEKFKELTHDADGIIVGVDKMDQEMLENCPNLKVICKFGVGLDNIDLEYCKNKGICVEKTVGSNAKSVAEHVIALLFAEAKNICTNSNDVKENMWNKPTGLEVSGKTIGIIGFGMIGKYLAQFANGLGMKVMAYDVFEIKEEIALQCNVQVASFDTIISECDYISLHIPLLENTRHMISTMEFKKMKNSACLLNTARGGIVDEYALYEALVSKEIRAACFDVFEEEPPQKDNKLLKLNNFILTAHTASRTVEAEERTCAMSCNAVVNVLLKGAA